MQISPQSFHVFRRKCKNVFMNITEKADYNAEASDFYSGGSKFEYLPAEYIDFGLSRLSSVCTWREMVSITQ